MNTETKPKRAIHAEVSEIRRILADVKKKFPWLATEGDALNANLRKIFSFLQDNDAADGWTQHNVEVAVEVLHPELEYDPSYVPPQPPPPPPAPPKPPVEVLEPGQISIHANKRDLNKATSAQILDYLRRIREAQ